MSKVWKDEEQDNPQIQRRYPQDYETDELKVILGNFEKRYTEAIKENPGFIRYDEWYSFGEVKLMEEMNAASFHMKPYPTMKVRIPGFPEYQRLKAAMQELQLRRKYAEEQEKLRIEALQD